MKIRTEAALFACLILSFASTVNCQQEQNETTSGRGPGPMGKEPPSQPFPYALSSTYLTYLARTEMDVYKNVGEYTKHLEERLRLAKAYMKEYEDSSMLGTSHLPEDADPWQKAAQAAAHPLIAYRMIRRFAVDFSRFVSHVQGGFESKLGEKVTKLAGLFNWPGDKDHQEAMDAILRLHYVYDLDLNMFASGNIQGIPTTIGLTTPQVFGIADYAAKNEYYTLAMQWLRLTETRIKQNDTSVSAFEVANTYKHNIDRHDRDFEKNSHMNHLYVFNRRIGGNRENLTSMKEMKTLEYYGERESDAPESGHYNFLSLCNGAIFQPESERTSLKCWYDHKRNPYFAINPLKMELLSKDPLLLQMYDVITDTWIADLRKTAMPTLQRAPPPTGPYTTPRTATYAWLEDAHIPNTPLARRIELITNLNVRGMAASEALQIASYAFGGHVSTHFDSLGVGNPNDPTVMIKGDRITTFLIYLNEVQKGGLTAFPVIGTHVIPVKGSAVLWYTSLKNGQVDSRMLHGACPVILGHKWIATKWTHQNVNFLKRPCGLDPNV